MELRNVESLYNDILSCVQVSTDTNLGTVVIITLILIGIPTAYILRRRLSGVIVHIEPIAGLVRDKVRVGIIDLRDPSGKYLKQLYAGMADVITGYIMYNGIWYFAVIDNRTIMAKTLSWWRGFVIDQLLYFRSIQPTVTTDISSQNMFGYDFPSPVIPVWKWLILSVGLVLQSGMNPLLDDLKIFDPNINVSYFQLSCRLDMCNNPQPFVLI